MAAKTKRMRLNPTAISQKYDLRECLSLCGVGGRWVCNSREHRWRDGCYDCVCHGHGIECHADRACVILMQTEAYQRQIMTPGACVEPRDDRCVCGVDGVPSCTVEVIDRNAHPATTIAFDLSLPYATEVASTAEAHSYISNPIFKQRLFRLPFKSILSYRPRSKQSRTYHRKTRSSKITPEDTESFATYGMRSTSGKEGSKIQNSESMQSSNDNYRESDIVYRTRHRLRSSRYKRNTEKKWMLANVRKSNGQLLHVPGSLLVITDNRCRYGVRWYGGGLRCFCDEEGSVTCGDPSFVASRIDGFRLEKWPCEEGHAWEEHGSCQECHCQISGVVLCRRSESCPLPFLIKPVQYDEQVEPENDEDGDVVGDDEDYFDEGDDHGNGDVIGGEEKITKRPYKPHVDVNLDSKNRPKFLPGRDRVGVGRYPLTTLPSTMINLPKPGSGRKIHGTTVFVQECKPSSRWLDGCKRCFCDFAGRKHCDDKRCLKPRLPSEAIKPLPISDKDEISGRPYQRPPSVPVVREGPVIIKPNFPDSKTCGRYKKRQVFWVKCNLCVCTSGGPRCTAKSCG